MRSKLLITLYDLENGIKISDYDSVNLTIRKVIHHLIDHVGATTAFYDLWDKHVSPKDVHNLRGEDFDDQSIALFVPYKSLLYRALKLYAPNFAKSVDSYYPVKTGFYYLHFFNHGNSSIDDGKLICLLDLVKSPKHLLKVINQNVGTKKEVPKMTDKECLVKVAEILNDFGKNVKSTYLYGSPMGKAMNLIQEQTKSKKVAEIQKAHEVG